MKQARYGGVLGVVVLVVVAVLLSIPSLAAVSGGASRAQVLSSTEVFADDFTVDPNTQTSWEIFRQTDDLADEASWDSATQAFYLTRADLNQGAAIFANYDLTARHWEARFRYKVGGGSFNGDGFTFMFYKDKANYQVWGGGNLGFTGFSGYGLEFDTVENPEADDPSNRHIGIILDSTGNHLTTVTDPRVADNEWHDVRIVFDNGNVTVFVDGGAIIEYQIPDPEYTYTGVGFSATTGGATNNHIIDDFRLTLLETTPPPFTPEGRIVFTTDRNGNWDLYTINADGTDEQAVSTRTTDEWFPSWSPDGSRILYDSHGNIYTIRPDGTDLTQLTEHAGWNAGPAWSPDGSKIAFGSARDGDFEIFVMDADGSNVTQLSFNEAEDWFPTWSPDSQRIAFDSTRDGSWDVFVMDADGSNVSRLTSNSGNDRIPNWSPDGSKIVFAATRWYGAIENTDIFVMNADGTNETRLTENLAFDWRPFWSPDGQFITFWSERDGNANIYVMNADGTNETRLTDNLAVDKDSAWQPVAGGVPATATPTPTAIPPTNTPTQTPVPPTNTPTQTTVPPTNTPTQTTVPPTNTPTQTPVPPTNTPTQTTVPPTNTPTQTTVPPTNTPTSTPTPTPTTTPTPTQAAATSTPTSTPNPSDDTPRISLAIPATAIEPGERFEISVTTTGTPGGVGIEFALTYDNTLVECSTGFPGDDMPVGPGGINLERSVCEAEPGRFEWVSTLSNPATGYPAGELGRIRFNAAEVDSSTTIRLVPDSVRLSDRDGNLLPITIGDGELPIGISASTVDGTVTCQVPGNPPRQTRIFASANNGEGTSIFTLATSGAAYNLPASTSGNPWSVIAACNCHINAQALNVTSPSTNNNAVLPAGDVVGADTDRDNGEINIRDIIAIAARLGGPTDTLACADLNADGTVNVQDITIARGNFGVREFLPFESVGNVLAQVSTRRAPIIDTSDLAQNAATVSCRVEPIADTPNAELIVEVANVTDLYGYSFDLALDSSLVSVDTPPWQPGNEFLNPELVVRNQATSERLSLAVTQQNPSEPVSGSGELARATLRPGAAAGTHAFTFTELILADRDGNFVAAQVGETCSFTSDGSDSGSPDRDVRRYLPLIRK